MFLFVLNKSYHDCLFFWWRQDSSSAFSGDQYWRSISLSFPSSLTKRLWTFSRLPSIADFKRGRLTATLKAIENCQNYLLQWLKTKDEKTWTQYILNNVGIAFEYVIIVDEQLTRNYLIADRLVDFYHVLYKYNATE